MTENRAPTQYLHGQPARDEWGAKEGSLAISFTFTLLERLAFHVGRFRSMSEWGRDLLDLVPELIDLIVKLLGRACCREKGEAPALWPAFARKRLAA